MLSVFLKERIPQAKKLVGELEKYYQFASILGSYVKTSRISVSSYTNSNDEVENECGFVIRVFKDGRYAEYSCDDILDIRAEDIIEAVKLNEIYSSEASLALPKEKKHEEDYLRLDRHPLTQDEIISRLTRIRNRAQKNKKIINVMCAYVLRETSKIYVSGRKCLTQKYDWINTMMFAVAREGNNIKENYTADGYVNSLEALKDLNRKSDSVVDIAVRLLDAKPVVPGKYTIITDPSISGLIAHEAFGHGVEMDMFVKNRAKAVNYVNKYVASEIVDMYDGAKGVISAGSYFFDDDGIEARKTRIIDKGILKAGISDNLSAIALNSVATGNGRRESYQRKAYTRMTNTYFGKGKDKVEDMIASVDYGYLLCETNNGMEDPKNWQIQCTASYGLEIKDGRLTGNIVAPVVISGYVIDLLTSISMVSDKVKITGSGMCGKGHKEWVYVADGGPYLKAEAKLG